VLDGEIVKLDETGRPFANKPERDLMAKKLVEPLTTMVASWGSVRDPTLQLRARMRPIRRILRP
jgi:hypothetical protein